MGSSFSKKQTRGRRLYTSGRPIEDVAVSSVTLGVAIVTEVVGMTFLWGAPPMLLQTIYCSDHSFGVRRAFVLEEQRSCSPLKSIPLLLAEQKASTSCAREVRCGANNLRTKRHESPLNHCLVPHLAVPPQVDNIPVNSLCAVARSLRPLPVGQL